jgi:hypothetical protein
VKIELRWFHLYSLRYSRVPILDRTMSSIVTFDSQLVEAFAKKQSAESDGSVLSDVEALKKRAAEFAP